MSNVVKRLQEKGIAHPPPWLPENIHYLTMMGSVAYGVNTDNSDVDLYGFCIPKKELIFPHLAGNIPGFGRQQKHFEQYQEHHLLDKEAGKEYDVSIFSIVKYFQLAMENNPNMIDSLFTPEFCVMHITRVGQMVRDNRRLFLHKGAWFKFKGYAYSQLHKADIKNPKTGSKRAESVEKYGWDVKFGYHVIRLIGEVEQILTEGNLDLQRNREHLKAIRAGEVSLEEVRKWFSDKEKSLEKLYNESSLQHSPDEEAIRALLLNCIEEHYGSLEGAVVQPDAAVHALRQIYEVLEKNKSLL
jgi:uncharacterized protein